MNTSGASSKIKGLLTDIMYDIPDRPDVERVTITAACARGEEPPQLIYKDDSGRQSEGAPASAS